MKGMENMSLTKEKDFKKKVEDVLLSREDERRDFKKIWHKEEGKEILSLR